MKRNEFIANKCSTMGAVLLDGTGTNTPRWVDPSLRDLVAEVSTREPRVFEPVNPEANSEHVRIVAMDCGTKCNIIRVFVRLYKAQLKAVPWDYDFSTEDMGGLFASSSLGNLAMASKTIGVLRKTMAERLTLPIIGICLGQQLLSLAAGANTYDIVDQSLEIVSDAFVSVRPASEASYLFGKKNRDKAICVGSSVDETCTHAASSIPLSGIFDC